MVDKELFTPDEVAEMLSLSRRTVDRLIAEKKLRCNRIGRSVRVSRKSIDEFLEATKNGAPAKGSR